jgi:hypothetical protein
MKNIALAAVLSVSATGAFAGGMAAPMMEPAVVVTETSPASGGIVIPLLILAIIAAVVVSD